MGNTAGKCVAPRFECPYPEVELDRNAQQGCISQSSCLGIGFAWAYEQGQVRATRRRVFLGVHRGFGAAEGTCLTPDLFCPYPWVEFIEGDQKACLTRDQCIAIGGGHFHQDGRCVNPADL